MGPEHVFQICVALDVRVGVVLQTKDLLAKSNNHLLVDVVWNRAKKFRAVFQSGKILRPWIPKSLDMTKTQVAFWVGVCHVLLVLRGFVKVVPGRQHLVGGKHLAGAPTKKCALSVCDGHMRLTRLESKLERLAVVVLRDVRRAANRGKPQTQKGVVVLVVKIPRENYSLHPPLYCRSAAVQF